MKQGAKLFFVDDAAKELFKHLVNVETIIGSYADSGGYIHGMMTPLCEYDTQSVVNVLRNGLPAQDKPFTATPTVRKEYYQETWR